MDGFTQGYDDIASSFAAEWYDFRASSSGFKLKQAVTMAVYSPAETDKVARYQAKKLAKGNDADFAKSCGEYARNDVFRSLNETIIENAHRDRKRGVRFARVTTGNETCLFCLMLASRGAVYKTRKTAGEFKSFHRGCDCKVAPGFEKDPLAELVEGHNPKAEYRKWQRIKLAREGMVSVPDFRKRSEIEAGYLTACRKYRESGKGSIEYNRTIGRYIQEIVPENPIGIEPYTMLRPKEIEEAVLLAKIGKKVFLRNADTKTRGENTSDAVVDGTLCDFKEITSPKIKRMTKEIVGKLDRQGPAFLVDIRPSPIRREDAEARLASLLEDPDINLIYLVSKDGIEELKK